MNVRQKLGFLLSLPIAVLLPVILLFIVSFRKNDVAATVAAPRLLFDRSRIFGRINDDEGVVNVLVGYHNRRGKNNVKNICNATTTTTTSTKQSAALKRVNVIEATIESEEQLDMLLNVPGIDYVELNPMVWLLGEVETPGLRAIRGGKSQIMSSSTIGTTTMAGASEKPAKEAPKTALDEKEKKGKEDNDVVISGAATSESTSTSNNTTTTTTIVGSCDDPNTVRVALIDSGVSISHPDIACDVVVAGNGEDDAAAGGNCIGISIGIGGLPWDEPTNDHGTKAAGIIGATRDNGIGVSGVVDSRSICWIIARVFASKSSVSMTQILSGIEWAVVDQKADVVNLSLGSVTETETENRFYRNLFDNHGVIFVAAAGNNGETQKFYPASYDSVLSVAAVDYDMSSRAFFSQYNDAVDIAAPGIGLLSTSLPKGSSDGVLFISMGGGLAVSGYRMHRSGKIDGQSGPLVNCDKGLTTCSSSSEFSSGHVCLLERTSPGSYGDQALNCEAGGGTAAIIYNNKAMFPLKDESLERETSVTIPVVGVTKEDGHMLLGHLGDDTRLSLEDSYGYALGTSFAAPFVTGAVAAALQACPTYNATQILHCLQQTALDLGAPGRDKYFGYGLVQVDGMLACCTGVGGDNNIPAIASTAPPTTDTFSVTTGKVMCSVQRPIYELCVKSHMTNDEWKQCVTCYNMNIPDLRCGERYCNKCQGEIELYLHCMVEEDGGTNACALGCSPVKEPAQGSTVRGSSAAIPTKNPNHLQTDDEHDICDAKQVEFESCMSSTAHAFQPQKCQECAYRSFGVFPQEESELSPSDQSEFCRQVNSNVCSSLNDCHCGSCKAEAMAYYACEFDSLIPDKACRIDCANNAIITENTADELQQPPAVTFVPAISSQDISHPTSRSFAQHRTTYGVVVATSFTVLLAAIIL